MNTDALTYLYLYVEGWLMART